jgi:hypothetical protein
MEARRTAMCPGRVDSEVRGGFPGTTGMGCPDSEPASCTKPELGRYISDLGWVCQCGSAGSKPHPEGTLPKPFHTTQVMHHTTPGGTLGRMRPTPPYRVV